MHPAYQVYPRERPAAASLRGGGARCTVRPGGSGSKVEFTDESIATYDFSNELRKFQWGIQFGGEWKAFKHLTVHADVTWGLNNIFQKDFDTITFNMYPIYLNLGFGYAF